MKSHRFIILPIIIYLAILSLMACPPDDSGNKESVVETIMSGQWSGDTGFGEILFTVDSDSTSIDSLEIIFVDYQCGQVTHGGSKKITGSALYRIIDRKIDFEVSLNSQGDKYIAINGDFEDLGDYITGDFELNNGTAVCSGTWSAEPI